MSDDKHDRPLTEDAPFLQRWSARKSEARQLQQTPGQVTEAGQEQTPGPVEPAEEQPELTDADMPPLESIDETTDMSGFFSPKVSAELRRMALRKLFHRPSYNIRDGLNDYDDDYTRFEPLGDIVTSDMKYMQQVAERKRREKLAEQQAQALVEEQPAEIDTETETETETDTDEVEDEISEMDNEQTPPSDPAHDDQETPT